MFDIRGHRAALLVLLASTALTSPARALDPSGTVVRVDRITDASGPGGTRTLVTEDPVYVGDEVSTNPNGLAQIQFLDDTKIVVGPNSRLVLDAFVFDPNSSTARQVAVDTARGFFRFISGNSPSSAYSIRTPTMTIGVRGTVVDIHAGADSSQAAFLEGSGEGCDDTGFCIPFESGCRIYEAPIGGGFAEPENRTDEQIQLSAYFPFITQSQNQLLPEFRANTSACTAVDNRLFQNPIQSPYR